MQPIEDLRLTSKCEEPRVWVSRFAVYPSWADGAAPIRDFPLTKGVNIVWAEEPKRGTPRPAIGGHSAGKTTFCRFLRYLLGETSFSTKENTALISAAFPDGYVAAEIHVLGRRWAVRRPLGTGRLSYILADGTLEDLRSGGGETVSKENYLTTLGFDQVLDDMPTRSVPREPRSLAWGHVLAWCSRDQEARFQSVYEWRSTRSESESPKFEFPKLGSLFAMRAVLGILPSGELGLEREIARMETEIEQIQEEVSEARRLPTYWSKHYRKRLNDWLERHERGEGAGVGDVGGLFSDPIVRAEASAGDLREEVTRLVGEYEQAESELIQAAVELRDWAKAREAHDLYFKLGRLSVEAVSAPENRGLWARWEELKNERCAYGRVFYGDCRHIQEERRLIRPQEIQDARHRDRAETDFQTEVDEEQRELAILETERLEIEGRRADLMQRRAALDREIRSRQRALEEFASIRAGIDEWDYNGANTAHEKVSTLQARLTEQERERRTVEDRLVLATTTVHENLARLQGIYSAAVRAVLETPGSDGQVVVHGRELAFKILRGLTLGGEAMGTLSVLLADFASMVHGCVSTGSSHPLLLIHDSPREADLELRLYEEFLLAAVTFEEALGGPSACPFQYIVTTTTAPPEEARSDRHIRLQLNSADPSELLLRRVVTAPTEGLLDPEDHRV